MATDKGNFLSVNTKLISSSIEDGLNECLPEVLECPVCYECMEPPIRLCRNGHSICSKCRPRLNNCPICRRTILLTRNFALEAVAEQCLEKCGNCDVGCNVKKTSVQDIINHMEICPYRLYSCEPGRSVGCTWVGRRWQILDHMHGAHATTFILKENNICKIKEFLFHDHSLTTQMIAAHGELFWFRHEKDSSKSKFFIAVQYIGPEKDAENYKYECKFTSTNSSGMEVKFIRNTHKDTEIIEDVFSSEDCLCVSIRVTKNFVSEDETLRFSLKVLMTE